jgi:hypothetical protein
MNIYIFKGFLHIFGQVVIIFNVNICRLHRQTGLNKLEFIKVDDETRGPYNTTYTMNA